MTTYTTGKNSRVLVTYGHEHVQEALREAADELDAYTEREGEKAGTAVTVHLELSEDCTWMFQIVIEET